MAYSKEQWERTKGYYEAGLSLSKITEKTGIARNTISQRAKREQWEHGRNTDYIEAKELIVTKKGTEKEQSLICADEVADDNIRRKNLVFGVTEKAVSIMGDMLEKGKVYDTFQKKKRPLMPSDVNTIVHATDKASLTLGVNQRHANSTVTVNNQNNMQNVTIDKDATPHEASTSYMEMIK